MNNNDILTTEELKRFLHENSDVRLSLSYWKGSAYAMYARLISSNRSHAVYDLKIERKLGTALNEWYTQKNGEAKGTKKASTILNKLRKLDLI